MDYKEILKLKESFKLKPFNPQFFVDLHIHSRFSRACSKNINIPNLVKWAKIKGLNLLGTGDFTHPIWLKELKELKEEQGILYYENFPFILSSEISLIYKQDEKVRRIHLVFLAPNLKTVDKINQWLDTLGRRDYDGRPIFKITCEEFVKKMQEIDEKIEVIPAHIWTPYFGLFGSKGGFNNLKEAFKEQKDKIHSIETGISSDPEMNWRIKDLEKLSIVSFSDAHCIHPNTFITLGDGYVLPISEIKNENEISCANINNFVSLVQKRKQFRKIPSPKFLKKIEYIGGEIFVSDKHRFFVYEEGRVVEKFAFELKKGDYLFRLAKLNNHKNKKISLKKPKVKIYYSLNEKGLNFIKAKRNEKRLLQKEVAKMLGIYVNHYWKLEKGLVKISNTFLKNLSKLFGFNLNTFIKEYALKKYFDFKFPQKGNVELFELLGYFIGNSCFSKINRGKCLILADKNKGILDYYKKITKKLFNCECNIRKETSQNSYRLTLPFCVARFFQLNFPGAIAKAKELRVPRLIFSSSFREIAGFLRGFFDAEGSIGPQGVEVCSSNKLLLFQVDSLLKKFGIFSAISLNQLEKTKQKYRHRLYLSGENLREFKKKINFNHIIKKNKLENYGKNFKVLRKSKIKRKGDFILSKIKSVNEIESDTKYLYDLAIPKNKNYIANQIIVHNSFWPWRLGREATIFNVKKDQKLNYDLFINQIRKNSFLGTLEVDPAYGKYHFDGHRDCDFSCSPKETKTLNLICPKCKKPLTLGVDYRVEELASKEKIKPKKFYYKLLPLHEIISLSLGFSVNSKSCWDIYNNLIKNFGNEFNILLNVSPIELKKVLKNDLLVELILKNRVGKINVKPGFDGVYGKAILPKKQQKLF